MARARGSGDERPTGGTDRPRPRPSVGVAMGIDVPKAGILNSDQGSIHQKALDDEEDDEQRLCPK